MLGCNKGTTLRTIIYRIVWVVFRSFLELFFFFLFDNTSSLFFSLSVYSIFVVVEEKKKSFVTVHNALTTIFYACVPFPGNADVCRPSYFHSLKLLSIYILSIFSPVVCMFKLDYMVFLGREMIIKRLTCKKNRRTNEWQSNLIQKKIYMCSPGKEEWGNV